MSNKKQKNVSNLNNCYSITLEELLERPIIRADFDEEWMNKMTDEELSQFDRESYQFCLNKGTPQMTKYIDRAIMYKLMKEHTQTINP